MAPRWWIVIGALLAGTGVGLGAFGAHGLPKYLDAQQITGEARDKAIKNFETAVRYQVYHALAACIVGLVVRARANRCGHAAGACFLFGTLIFSGLLYVISLGGPKALGAIVPVGGVLHLIGWGLLAIAACGPRAGGEP